MTLLVVSYVICFTGFHAERCLGSQPVQAAEVDMGLRAGGAYADIKPQRVLPNYNGTPLYAGDPEKILQAHVIVCTDGETQVAILSLDATFVGRDLVLRIRDELQHRIGIDPGHVMIGATHSHHTPATAASFLAGAVPDPMYVDFLVDRIGDAAQGLRRGSNRPYS